jgi:hypothetical protein
VLKAGTQKLSAVFTPTDTSTYSAATATVQLTVTKANPVITWPPPSAIQQVTAISTTQLNATAKVPGTFSYRPATGTVPPVGTRSIAINEDPTLMAGAKAHLSATRAVSAMLSTAIISQCPRAISA